MKDQKKGLGRPKLPKGKGLSQAYGARLKPDEEKLVLNAIMQSGLKKSEWIRRALVYAAQR